MKPSNRNSSCRQWINVSRRARVPDRLRIARYMRSPELGPRVLFFSGGTALRATSAELIRYTHHSVHLITPFDSGGSSAKLRDAFPMISVGDLRNRLMALADRALLGHPAVHRLFDFRLSTSASTSELREQLRSIIVQEDSMIVAIPSPLRRLICTYLGFFYDRMPNEFDLRGANIGNLILAGGYLNHDHDMDAVLFLFSRLVEVRGSVRPVVNANLHLAAELEDGSVLVGQHRITNVLSERPSIRRIHLCLSQQEPDSVDIEIDSRTRELIEEAELICFPIGSFYTSVMACLLPQGIGEAVAQAGCPKVFVPNCRFDPEQGNMRVEDAVDTLVDQLCADMGGDCPISRVLNFVIVDRQHGNYPGGLNLAAIEARGVQVIDASLTNDASNPSIDARKLAEALVSLA